jgi:isoquinoline 1-oxidoreductase beta subunit
MKSTVTRREAVETGIALMIGFALPSRGKSAPGSNEFNAWVRISTDNQITVLAETPEMGQGTRTANIMMLAEELELDWSSVRWEQAPTIPRLYKDLEAGGSSGTTRMWLKLRKAGAQTREMLLTAAAQRWGVDVKSATQRMAPSYIQPVDDGLFMEIWCKMQLGYPSPTPITFH